MISIIDDYVVLLSEKEIYSQISLCVCCIGNLIAGSRLKELFQIAYDYAENSVACEEGSRET